MLGPACSQSTTVLAAHRKNQVIFSPLLIYIHPDFDSLTPGTLAITKCCYIFSPWYQLTDHGGIKNKLYQCENASMLCIIFRWYFFFNATTEKIEVKLLTIAYCIHKKHRRYENIIDKKCIDWEMVDSLVHVLLKNTSHTQTVCRCCSQ